MSLIPGRDRNFIVSLGLKSWNVVTMVHVVLKKYLQKKSHRFLRSLGTLPLVYYFVPIAGKSLFEVSGIFSELLNCLEVGL